MRSIVFSCLRVALGRYRLLRQDSEFKRVQESLQQPALYRETLLTLRFDALFCGPLRKRSLDFTPPRSSCRKSNSPAVPVGERPFRSMKPGLELFLFQEEGIRFHGPNTAVELNLNWVSSGRTGSKWGQCARMARRLSGVSARWWQGEEFETNTVERIAE
jgi:hypothetical protein